jgi:hypothetical protein
MKSLPSQGTGLDPNHAAPFTGTPAPGPTTGSSKAVPVGCGPDTEWAHGNAPMCQYGGRRQGHLEFRADTDGARDTIAVRVARDLVAARSVHVLFTVPLYTRGIWDSV